MDGQNPAPPKKPWKDDSPVNNNKLWLPMVSSTVGVCFRALSCKGVSIVFHPRASFPRPCIWSSLIFGLGHDEGHLFGSGSKLKS